ncbi:Golgi integral membrane protein 4a isoform X2 [Paramisgurnus dabryanus]|uniref:Golgi integral membrane protein 4a isoform X2 n=1 Tax=Paramisgurnus dabryanus TaxID=90735 RepID=UPI003CCFB425
MRNIGGFSVPSKEEKIPRKLSADSKRTNIMGNGVCSRKQKKIFQSLIFVTVVCGMIYGGMVSYEMHKQLKRTEAMALKYQQHQESLSAQLQVVYEHRSRLEKSLQKERLDHKKAKEDYLMYKLEAQQSLNKEKQDGNVRFNSLHSQHQILKNQHDDLKKQYYELQERHQLQGDEHNRAVDEHKQKLDELHQNKELEISKLKENVYSLREENKQLRKAHQEIYVNLQDTRQQHKSLKSSHDQLVLTLEDHKSALAAAQVQLDEFKQLKDTLNKVPSLRQDAGEPQPRVDAHPVQNRQHINPEEIHQFQQNHQQLEKQDMEKPQPSQSNNRDEDGELGGGAEERRRELAEEEMEQAGQPQKLEEEFDPAHNEVEGEEQQVDQPDENALVNEKHAQVVAPAEVQVQNAQVERVKSAYEQQQEQQRLAAQLAEERRQLHLRQEALERQQLQQQKEREERLRLQREKEKQQNREADLKEQQIQQEMLRKRSHYENMDADVIQGEEDPHIPEEKERNVHQEEPILGGEEHVHQRHVEGDVDPENDPNNQGEDEFEEAEQQHHHEGEEEEEVAPVRHPDIHLPKENQHQAHADEQLVMAGNPDQQEDNLDEPYQEDGDDEAQDEIVENQKPMAGREEEGDNYNEQEDAGHQDVAVNRDAQPVQDPNEENYEDEEEDANGDKPPNGRAEM